VNATVPLATLVAMVALVAGLLMGLAWRRTHRPAPRVEAEPARLPASADYEQLFRLNPHPMYVYDIESQAFLAVN
jgi:hypothetical protein